MKCFAASAAVAATLLSCQAGEDAKKDPSGRAVNVAAALKDHTWRLKDGALEKADAGKLPPVVAVYHSMWGCAGCLPVTQKLAALYDRDAAAGGDRRFEVVLVSVVGDQALMTKYMSKTGMKWLALTPSENEKNSVAQIGKKEFVPNLVLITPDGKALSTDTDESFAQLEKLIPEAKKE